MPIQENAAAVLSKVKAEAEAYVSGSRHIYTHFVDRVRPTCDLVLDGTLGPDELASQVVVALRQQLSIPRDHELSKPLIDCV